MVDVNRRKAALKAKKHVFILVPYKRQPFKRNHQSQFAEIKLRCIWDYLLLKASPHGMLASSATHREVLM